MAGQAAAAGRPLSEGRLRPQQLLPLRSQELSAKRAPRDGCAEVSKSDPSALQGLPSEPGSDLHPRGNWPSRHRASEGEAEGSRPKELGCGGPEVWVEEIWFEPGLGYVAFY